MLISMLKTVISNWSSFFLTLHSPGPAILFEQYDQPSKSFRQFFACSAFRDKKECAFRVWADEESPKSTQVSKQVSHKQYRMR